MSEKTLIDIHREMMDELEVKNYSLPQDRLLEMRSIILEDRQVIYHVCTNEHKALMQKILLTIAKYLKL